MFGDEHLGRAVALRREFRGMTQLALARAIGVNKSTMNGYESGSRGMDDGTLERISTILECDSIEIWADAFKIFSFNYSRERAEKAGVPVAEWVARRQQRPSMEQVREAFHAIGDKVWQLLSAVLAFLRPDREYESQSGVPVWGVVVHPHTTTKRKRAIRFRQGKQGSRQGTKSRPQES
jgi:transcriptional regulator with XRE-family HTH domain